MNTSQLSDPMIEEAGRIFSALADPSRLKILRLLMAARAPMSQGTLAEEAGLSQANASKHLMCLIQSGLVVRERGGNQAFYHVATPLVGDVCGLVRQHVIERSQAAYQSLR